MNCLSFDVGGTTVKYGVIDESYKILKKDKIPTPENENDFIYSLSNIKIEKPCIARRFASVPPAGPNPTIVISNSFIDILNYFFFFKFEYNQGQSINNGACFP